MCAHTSKVPLVLMLLLLLLLQLLLLLLPLLMLLLTPALLLLSSIADLSGFRVVLLQVFIQYQVYILFLQTEDTYEC